MKNKHLNLSALLWLGFGLTGIQAQPIKKFTDLK
jgi:hypothetical protein